MSAIARQKTPNSFQKHVLLTAVLLLVCAIISNVLITIFVTQPNPTNGDATVLTKRVQATFDYLFGIVIGAFIVIATTPSVDSREAFFRRMTQEFPNSYVFYVFIMCLALVSIFVSNPQVTTTVPIAIQFEPWFLVINGLAVGTIILYAPYRFISHLKRTKPGSEIRQDTYLIILGITGFAVGELLFEVVLPNFAVDLRSPGFILEIALVGLIAYATREKSFLLGLNVPEAEANLMTKPTYNLERGFTYAILERDGEQAFEVFKDLVTHGAQGLCITRRTSKSVMNRYQLERTPILWLSRTASEKNSVRPSPPENVAMAIQHFVEVGQNGVILFDGFEYMVSHNDFSSVLALLHDLNEKVSLQDAILLLPFDPAVFTEREIALNRRDVRFLGPLAAGLDEFGEKVPATP